jgi:methyl-accepting chemotaxis protein
MKWFNNMKIGTKLLLSFSVLILLAIFLGLFSLYQMTKINKTTNDFTLKWMPSVRITADMNTDASIFRIAELQQVLSDDAREMEVYYENELDRVASVFNNHRQEYEKLISSPEEQNMYDEFSKKWKAYLNEHNNLLLLSRAGKKEEATALLRGSSQQIFDEASLILTNLAIFNVASGEQATHEAGETYVFSQNSVLALLIVIVAIALGLTILVTRSIQRQLGGEPAYAAAITKRIAGGDLAVNVAVDSKYAGSLLHNMKEMRDSLVRIVSEVRNGTETMVTASSQIAAGNFELSSRTEEQASSLEETAASMEELTSTVKQNANNAKQANQFAVTASEVAVKGGEVVSKVVDTMGSINDSAKKIANIISVIDGIAFQTNILALNAAVEAARAGEQGRGFAVVASEVRNLAQRSASAAKEIKGLISDSVEKVDAGSRLVTEAGTTMDEIVDSVRRVTHIMAEITAASQEQSSGIEQVNKAISQMDQVTQQNAALVEEATAAAESLQDQAGKLTDVVSVFKLAGMQTAAPTGAVAAKPRLQSNEGQPAARRQSVLAPAYHPGQGKLAHTASGSNDKWEEF